MDLYWLPLGAGGHSVRWNGRAFEAVAARLKHRSAARPLSLRARSAAARSGAICDRAGSDPGRARQGAGAWLQRGLLVRAGRGARGSSATRCDDGETASIPDVADAVESPLRLTDDPRIAQRLWDCVPDLPTPVWGRDELGAGEMWNSNSIVSWLIVRSGLPIEAIQPPAGGRAPGWNAGIVVARRGLQAGSELPLGSAT